MQKLMYTIKSVYKYYNSNALIEGNGIKYFNVRYYRYSCYKLPSDTNFYQNYKSSVNYTHVINYPITKLNSVALVRTRTIPTERPPPVGEVSANFCG